MKVRVIKSISGFKVGEKLTIEYSGNDVYKLSRKNGTSVRSHGMYIDDQSDAVKSTIFFRVLKN